MPAGKRRDRELIAKIRSRPADKLVEVEDFVDFLGKREQERRLAKAVAGASEAAFAKVWDNADDAAYDRLSVQRRQTKARHSFMRNCATSRTCHAPCGLASRAGPAHRRPLGGCVLGN
jgi:hypothetical protein